MKRKTHPPTALTDSKIHTYSVEMPRLPQDYKSLNRHTGPFYDPYQVYRSGPEPSTLTCKQRGYIDDPQVGNGKAGSTWRWSYLRTQE